MISKSLDCKIKFDDSEEPEVTDGDEDNVCTNQTTTDVSKYLPKPNVYKNSTCSKCICENLNTIQLNVQYNRMLCTIFNYWVEEI